MDRTGGPRPQRYLERCRAAVERTAASDEGSRSRDAQSDSKQAPLPFCLGPISDRDESEGRSADRTFHRHAEFQDSVQGVLISRDMLGF